MSNALAKIDQTKETRFDENAELMNIALIRRKLQFRFAILITLARMVFTLCSESLYWFEEHKSYILA